MVAADQINRYSLTVTISPFCAFLAFCRMTANYNHTSGGCNNSTTHSTAITTLFCRHQAILMVARRGTRPTVLAVEVQRVHCQRRTQSQGAKLAHGDIQGPDSGLGAMLVHNGTTVFVPKEGQSHKSHLP